MYVFYTGLLRASSPVLLAVEEIPCKSKYLALFAVATAENKFAGNI